MRYLIILLLLSSCSDTYEDIEVIEEYDISEYLDEACERIDSNSYQEYDSLTYREFLIDGSLIGCITEQGFEQYFDSLLCNSIVSETVYQLSIRCE